MYHLILFLLLSCFTAFASQTGMANIGYWQWSQRWSHLDDDDNTLPSEIRDKDKSNTESEWMQKTQQEMKRRATTKRSNNNSHDNNNNHNRSRIVEKNLTEYTSHFHPFDHTTPAAAAAATDPIAASASLLSLPLVSLWNPHLSSYRRGDGRLSQHINRSEQNDYPTAIRPFLTTYTDSHNNTNCYDDHDNDRHSLAEYHGIRIPGRDYVEAHHHQRRLDSCYKTMEIEKHQQQLDNRGYPRHPQHRIKVLPSKW